jgi:hypothetical protein
MADTKNETVDRRGFLKALGLGAGATATATVVTATTTPANAGESDTDRKKARYKDRACESVLSHQPILSLDSRPAHNRRQSMPHRSRAC